MTSAGRRTTGLAMIGGGLVALVALGLLALFDSALPLADETRNSLTLTAECIGGALWLGAVALVRRGPVARHTVWLVLAVAVAMRSMTLSAPLLLSSDLYRYVWDGRVQRAGVNPYRFVPASAELAFLRDDAVYPNINRAAYAPTIYPPAAQGIFAVAALVAPGVAGMKAIMAAFDATAIAGLAWLLLRLGRPLAELLLYAWLPLPVWDFCGDGHIDAAAAGLLVVALLTAARRWPVATGAVLAAAALTKYLPAVVLPAFWRSGRWRMLAAFVACAIALYLPYLGAGKRVLGFLGGYVGEEDLATGRGFFPLELLSRVVSLPRWAPWVYVCAVATALAALAWRSAFGPSVRRSTVDPWAHRAPEVSSVDKIAGDAVVLGAALLVALSPHYPWYLAWLAPLACIVPYRAVLWLLAAAPLLAFGPIQHLLIPTAVYGPAAALTILDLRRRRATHVTANALIETPPQAARSAH